MRGWLRVYSGFLALRDRDVQVKEATGAVVMGGTTYPCAARQAEVGQESEVPEGPEARVRHQPRVHEVQVREGRVGFHGLHVAVLRPSHNEAPQPRELSYPVWWQRSPGCCVFLVRHRESRMGRTVLGLLLLLFCATAEHRQLQWLQTGNKIFQTKTNNKCLQRNIVVTMCSCSGGRLLSLRDGSHLLPRHREEVLHHLQAVFRPRIADEPRVPVVLVGVQTVEDSRQDLRGSSQEVLCTGFASPASRFPDGEGFSLLRSLLSTGIFSALGLNPPIEHYRSSIFVEQ